jgi:hypothetical protein
MAYSHVERAKQQTGSIVTEEEIKKMANEMASLIHKNIRDVTTALTVNLDYEKAHTILAAFAGVYSVQTYFEYKLTELGITPDAIQKAKEGADNYVVDVISGDRGAFPLKKGDA